MSPPSQGRDALPMLHTHNALTSCESVPTSPSPRSVVRFEAAFFLNFVTALFTASSGNLTTSLRVTRLVQSAVVATTLRSRSAAQELLEGSRAGTHIPGKSQKHFTRFLQRCALVNSWQNDYAGHKRSLENRFLSLRCLTLLKFPARCDEQVSSNPPDQEGWRGYGTPGK